MSFNKSEVRDAYQLTAENALELALWCGGKLVEEIHPETEEKTPGINVLTLRGIKRASLDDYIVLNVFDEFDVVNARTYNEE